MAWWEHAVAYLAVALAVCGATVGWTLEWERSTRPRCEPPPKERLIASHETRDLVACYYVTRAEVWGQVVRKDIKERKAWAKNSKQP